MQVTKKKQHHHRTKCHGEKIDTKLAETVNISQYRILLTQNILVVHSNFIEIEWSSGFYFIHKNSGMKRNNSTSDTALESNQSDQRGRNTDTKNNSKRRAYADGGDQVTGNESHDVNDGF